MLTGGLHPGRRNGPNPLRHIELAPRGPPSLAGAGGGQDEEGQRLPGGALAPAKARKKGRNVVPWHRRVVLDRLHFSGSRQEVREMAAPAGRVVARAPAAGLGIVQDQLDPLPRSARGLGLLRPDGLKRLHHVAGADRRHGEGGKLGEDVILEALPPLLRVHLAPPGGLMGGDVEFGHGLEREPAARGSFGLPPLGQGVNPVLDLLAAAAGPFPSFLEAERISRPEPHPVGPLAPPGTSPIPVGP